MVQPPEGSCRRVGDLSAFAFRGVTAADAWNSWLSHEPLLSREQAVDARTFAASA